MEVKTEFAHKHSLCFQVEHYRLASDTGRRLVVWANSKEAACSLQDEMIAAWRNGTLVEAAAKHNS